MKKKSILGTILVLSLAITIAVAAVTPAIAKSPAASSAESGNSATVRFHLPPPGGALAGHPTEIRIDVFDYDQRSGGVDALQFQIWVPTLNMYVPIATIGDQPATSEMRATYNNTPVYLEINGVVIRNNIKLVADNELDVWATQAGQSCWAKDGMGRWIWNVAKEDTLTANLTVPVGPLDFTGLPPFFGTSFTIPPMCLKFTGIAAGVPFRMTASLPNGAKFDYKSTQVPAYVEAELYAWLGGAEFTVGQIGQHFTMTPIA